MDPVIIMKSLVIYISQAVCRQWSEGIHYSSYKSFIGACLYYMLEIYTIDN